MVWPGKPEDLGCPAATTCRLGDHEDGTFHVSSRIHKCLCTAGFFEYTLLFACSFGSPSSISFPGEPERASHQEVIESGIGGVDGHRVPQRRNRQCEWAVTKQMTTELVMNRRKTYATLHASPRARGTRVKLGTQGGGVGHTAA